MALTVKECLQKAIVKTIETTLGIECTGSEWDEYLDQEMEFAAGVLMEIAINATNTALESERDLSQYVDIVCLHRAVEQEVD